MTALLDKLFDLSGRGTTLRRELVGGLTTFFAIAYTIILTPSYLSQVGMDYTAALIATCIASALGCFLCAALGLPFILAPGVSLIAFFTYTLCGAMGFTWQQGLAVVVIAGAIYLVITLTPLREQIIACIPQSMRSAITAGLGMFIALIGLFNGGLVTAEGGTLSLGDLSSPPVLLAALGVLITGALMAWKVQGDMLIGIVVTTLIGIPAGVTVLPERVTMEGLSLAPGLLRLDLGGVLSLGAVPLASAIITFTMCMCFDTLGSLLSVAEAGGMLDERGGLGKNSRVLTLSALATCASACLGTAPLIPPVECATGIARGARTGLHSLTVGVLFLLAILAAPIASIIPAAATAPALILIGMLMIGAAADVNWRDLETALPCFLTMIMIPFTYSVSNGIGIGLISYAVIHLVTGKAKQVAPMAYVLAGLFVGMFVLSAL